MHVLDPGHWPGPWWSELVGAAPDAELLVDAASGARFSRAEVDVLLRRVAGWLDGRGVPRGARILVEASPALEGVLVAMGAAWSGRVPCVLPPGLPPEGAWELAARLDAVHDERPTLAGPDLLAELAAAAPVAALPALPPEEDAAIVLTSGSTGAAKGVRLSHRALVGSLGRSPVFVPGRPDRCGIAQSLHTITAFRAGLLLPALVGGAAVLLPASSSPLEVFEVVRREEVTVAVVHAALVHATVAQAAQVAAVLRPPGGGAALTRVLGGGTPIAAGVRSAFARATGADLAWAYGLTETAGGIAVAYARPDGSVDDNAGRPLLPVELRPEPGYPEDTGRLVVHAPVPYSGYVGGPAHEGPVVTADLARIDEHGFLHVLGRADRVHVDRAGNKVLLDEVEAALAGLGVRGCVVAAGGALVGVHEGRRDPEELRRALSARLPLRAIPGRWLQVPALPLLPGGKVDLREVARLVAAALAADSPPT